MTERLWAGVAWGEWSALGSQLRPCQLWTRLSREAPYFWRQWLIALSAARAPAGRERGGDWSAGPAGGRAAGGERSEPP